MTRRGSIKKYVVVEKDTWKLKTDSTVLNHVKKNIYKPLNELVEKDNPDFLPRASLPQASTVVQETAVG